MTPSPAVAAALAAIGTPAFLEDPYPSYATLRGVPPVRDARLGGWVVTRYADVKQALGEPALASGGRVHALLRQVVPERTDETRWIADHFDRTLPFLRPPRHGVIRALLMRALTPRVVEGLRPGIAALATDLLDRAPDGATAGRLDLAGALTLPLPMAVIGLLLGVPAADRARFLDWTADLFRIFGPAAEVPAQLPRIGAALQEARGYLDRLVAERARDPGDDLVSLLLAARDEEGRRLDHEDIVANCLTLFTAGHETTQGLLGNGILALLRTPGAWPSLSDAARDGPGPIRVAIEEMLRHDAPLQRGWRLAEKDVDLGGVTIPAGDLVMLFLGAADRDPAAFPDADRFDAARTPNRHLAFGHGAHFCIGAGLARLEAEVVLGLLLHRTPRLRLAGSPARRPDITFRVLTALPVEAG